MGVGGGDVGFDDDVAGVGDVGTAGGGVGDSVGIGDDDNVGKFTSEELEELELTE